MDFLKSSLSICCLTLLTAACGAPAATKATFTTAITGPLAIRSLTPNSAPTNSVPFTMIVNGANFDTNAQAFWNNVPQSTLFVNGSQLQVSVTAADMSFPGSAAVYVRSNGVNSNTVEFSVTF
jgi:IPT/TIG domain